MLAIPVLLTFELAVIMIALGFLLHTQSDSMVVSVIAAVIIVLGVVCLAISISKGFYMPASGRGLEGISYLLPSILPFA